MKLFIVTLSAGSNEPGVKMSNFSTFCFLDSQMKSMMISAMESFEVFFLSVHLPINAIRPSKLSMVSLVAS